MMPVNVATKWFALAGAASAAAIMADAKKVFIPTPKGSIPVIGTARRHGVAAKSPK